jgi:hypothetical protein
MARLPGVGPVPASAAESGSTGFLQVYSARERLPININGEEFAWNSDYGQNEFLYGAAHTGYSLFNRDGQLLMQVPNAKGMHDADPTLLKLAPGDYQVRAEAADFDGVVSAVLVPVCVQAGQTTLVHLDGKWDVGTPGQGGYWVRLANGSVVGWHCSDSEGATFASSASN